MYGLTTIPELEKLFAQLLNGKENKAWRVVMAKDLFVIQLLVIVTSTEFLTKIKTETLAENRSMPRKQPTREKKVVNG